MLFYCLHWWNSKRLVKEMLQASGKCMGHSPCGQGTGELNAVINTSYALSSFLPVSDCQALVSPCNLKMAFEGNLTACISHGRVKVGRVQRRAAVLPPPAEPLLCWLIVVVVMGSLHRDPVTIQETREGWWSNHLVDRRHHKSFFLFVCDSYSVV